MRDPSEDANERRRQFEKRYNEYFTYLLRYALRLIGNPADAEDITATAFLRFLKIMERTGWKVVKVKPYLKMIVKNLSRDFWRRRAVTVEVSIDDEQNEQILENLQGDDLIARIENDMDCKKLLGEVPLKVIFGGLGEDDFELLRLYWIEEMTRTEISREVGRDVYQVNYQLNKLMAKIRARVIRYLKNKDVNNPFE